jgi:hypothetical protein
VAALGTVTGNRGKALRDKELIVSNGGDFLQTGVMASLNVRSRHIHKRIGWVNSVKESGTQALVFLPVVSLVNLLHDMKAKILSTGIAEDI